MKVAYKGVCVDMRCRGNRHHDEEDEEKELILIPVYGVRVQERRRDKSTF